MRTVFLVLDPHKLLVASPARILLNWMPGRYSNLGPTFMEAGALTTHLLTALEPVAKACRNFDLDTIVTSLTSNDLFIWKLFALAT
jgi:hypothetical protein